MTPLQIHDELRPRIRGRVIIDDLERRLYSTDASPFQILPVAVIVPVDDDDLQTVVKFAYERAMPIVPRGAGTGLAGESLTNGIVLDLSVHFRKILELGDDWIRVQPGVTLRELNDALAPRGRRFAVEMPNSEVVTVGGMIATNASSCNAFRHGSTLDYVLALKIINDSGEFETIGIYKSETENERELLVRTLLAANEDAIRAEQPKTKWSHAGYRLHDVLAREGVNLLPLIVGSEGTLAITAEALLRTVPIVGGTAQFAIGFNTLDDALTAGLALQGHEGIAGCDLLDQRLLSMARMAKDVIPVPGETTAALVVTHEADTPDEALSLSRMSFDAIRGAHAVLVEPAVELEARARVARFRETAVYGFYALASSKRPEPIIEDFSVPPEHLPQFLGVAQQLLREADLAASFLTQMLTGTIHCRPLVNLTEAADQAKAWPLANHLCELALALGGSISAQHGVGLARTPWMEKQFPALMPVFREIKRIFDPKNILNPGKIVGSDPARPAWPFRKGQGAETIEPKATTGSKPELEIAPMPLVLYSQDSLVNEVRKCNACGDCRVRVAPSRMCPMFRATGDEAATPRAKANTLMAVLENAAEMSNEDVKSVAKLCVHCTRCRSECKAGIDIPTLMLEAKAAHFVVRGFDRGEWLIARTERLAALAGTFAFTANSLLSWKWSRWLMEKAVGLSRKRMLHRFTHRTYLRRRLVQRLFRREAAGTRKFAYFIDTFANYNDPLIAEATVAILEYHGFGVHVPQRQRGSGMAQLSVGDIERARANAAYNVRTLAELVRDGYTIVCSEPTAALAIRTEYPRLLQGDDANLVASNTVEMTALLADLQVNGELKPFIRELDYRIGHHAPCHLKSLGTVAAPALLATIPKLKVTPLDVGCSGSAGPWGLTKVNFETSMRIGEPVFAALAGRDYGATECSTCRMQIQQGCGLRTLHPVQWLALGYGLVPQLEARLSRPLKPRLTG